MARYKVERMEHGEETWSQIYDTAMLVTARRALRIHRDGVVGYGRPKRVRIIDTVVNKVIAED